MKAKKIVSSIARRTAALVLALVACVSLPAAAATPDDDEADSKKVELSAGFDLVSSYIWRGTDCGGVSIQPAATVSWRGLSFGAWGSAGFDGDDTKELDLSLGYAVKGFSVGITDYWFSKNSDGDASRYFLYRQGNPLSTHMYEAAVGYDFGFASITWNTVFGGRDGLTDTGHRAYSSYCEVGVPFTVRGFDCAATVGVVPYGTSLYGTHKFACTNVSLSVARTLKLSTAFSLPLTVTLTANPQAEKMFFTAGVGLFASND